MTYREREIVDMVRSLGRTELELYAISLQTKLDEIEKLLAPYATKLPKGDNVNPDK